MARTQRGDRGSMLIIALGVLALLSVLAITFVSLMRLELLASKNYVDGVKARLAAEAGLESTVTELKTRAAQESVSDPRSDWNYADGRYWLPLEEASAKRDRGDAADWARRCSFVGTLGASYSRGVDRFRVRVVDTQAQLNLNNVFDGLSSDPEDRTANVWARQLAALGEAIRQGDPRAGGQDPVKSARFPATSPTVFGAEAVLAYRQTLEGHLFRSKEQLREVLASEAHWNLLKDYVTVSSWLDPHTTVAFNHDGLNEAYSDCFAPRPVPGELPAQRAPINVNLAPVEVLAANLAGLSGRATFVWYGDRSKSGILQQIDEGTKYVASAQRPDGSLIQEELEYASLPCVVYMGPMGWREPAASGAPPLIDGALAIAKLIDARRRGTASTGSTAAAGPFKSFADWERWVDLTITDSFLQNTKDASGNAAFPQPEAAPVFQAKDHGPLAGVPTAAQVRAHPRFRAWFYEGLRSILKANANPNGRPSLLNPNPATFLPVDKGSLLYPKRLATPTGLKFNAQTCEWCFGSKGIFEIVSLGEVLGPATASAALATVVPGPTLASSGASSAENVYAQAKILTVVQLFEQLTHTSQRDFERNAHPPTFTAGRTRRGGFGDEPGALPPGNGLRFGVQSAPFAKTLWDPRVGAFASNPRPTADERNLALEAGGVEDGWHAHDDVGHLELSPRVTLKGKAQEASVATFGNLLFALYFQDRRVRVPVTPAANDLFVADVANGSEQNPKLGLPVEGEPQTAFAMPYPYSGYSAATGFGSGSQSGPAEMFQRLVNPDGLLQTDVRTRPLWYHASDKYSVAGPADGNWPPDGRFQGDSIPTGTGNVWATPTGGAGFWFKPDFDWFAKDASGKLVPDERLCGFLSTTNVTFNEAVKNWDKPDGYARPTRGLQMFVTRNSAGDLRVTRLYFEIEGPAGDEIPWVTDIKPGAGPDPALPPIRVKDYMDKARTNPEYTWPPLELQTIPKPWHDIKFARVDTWVPASRFEGWRAHEWHHVALRWDDRGTLPGGHSIEVYLDGLTAPVIHHEVGPHYQAVVNRPGQVATNPPTVFEDMPSFCRLNQTSQGSVLELRRPKDQLQIGSIQRTQSRRGGLFKFDTTAELPANGTLDDVQLWDGVSAKAAGFADRFEEYGVYTNELDLSNAFGPGTDWLELGSLGVTAYLPQSYGTARCAPNRAGAGSVAVTLTIQRATGPEESFDLEVTDHATSPGAVAIRGKNGTPVLVSRADRLVYTVKIFPARLQGGVLGGDSGDRSGFAVATPALDDLTLVYALPVPRVLARARLFD